MQSKAHEILYGQSQSVLRTWNPLRVSVSLHFPRVNFLYNLLVNCNFSSHNDWFSRLCHNFCYYFFHLSRDVGRTLLLGFLGCKLQVYHLRLGKKKSHFFKYIHTAWVFYDSFTIASNWYLSNSAKPFS